jgi:hypothetical protein
MHLRPESLERRREKRRARKRTKRRDAIQREAAKRPPRTVYVGSHEDRLSRLRPMQVDPDDDGRTREDQHGDRSVFADSVLEPVDMPRWLRGRRRARRDKLGGMD